MTFTNILTPDSIYIDSVSQSKAAVLLNLSKRLNQCHPELNTQVLFDAYWERENLGTTTIGHGIIIPHIRVLGIKKTCGCFLKLVYPVDFGAEDKQPIDLVFGLAVAADQTNEHLNILAKIVKQFNDPHFRSACRLATTPAQLCELFIESSPVEAS